MSHMSLDGAAHPATANHKSLLAPLVSDPGELRAEFRRRKTPFEYARVAVEEVDQKIADGWEQERTVTTGVWLRRSKVNATLLEDRVWCLLWRMGYPVLNGPRFKITFSRQNKSIGSKQVDVFAKDDETVIVIECKARDTLGRRTLTQDIHEFENLKGSFADSIKQQFGDIFNPKIIWMVVTDNIIWNERDLERAEAANIRVVTQNELTYFESFIAHMGSAGRYQFLAEFLRGQEIPSLSGIKVPATWGTFGSGINYYSFVIPARHLLKIAFVNHQALNHPDGRPAYQRMISKARIKQIGEFISNGGFFPTNILINLTESCVFEPLPKSYNSHRNAKFGVLTLPNKYKSAWIIDGQH